MKREREREKARGRKAEEGGVRKAEIGRKRRDVEWGAEGGGREEG